MAHVALSRRVRPRRLLLALGGVVFAAGAALDLAHHLAPAAAWRLAAVPAGDDLPHLITLVGMGLIVLGLVALGAARPGAATGQPRRLGRRPRHGR